jgi:3-oxoacyl-[acyl-carrier protein] reductase
MTSFNRINPSNKIVIITGAGSGMGKELCRYFAERNWAVGAADISAERAQNTVAELSALSPDILAIAVDTRISGEVKHMLDVCVTRFGRDDALVNNAGITDKQHRRLLDLPYTLWQEILSTNVTGSYTCLKESAEFMGKQGGGNIVNITSLLGQTGYAREGDAAYGISKAALEMLTECAALELAESKINVNSVYPGVKVNTGFFDYLDPDERKELTGPGILNELVYLLCMLEPGELSGKSICVQNWKEGPRLKSLSRKYVHGGANERAV